MPTAQKYSILVVEDQDEIASPLLALLRHEGYRCLYASDGLNGLAVFQREQPDLVLLDLMLPKMDGVTLCMKIRDESNVPVIMLTARDSEDEKVQGLEAGADDYVTKPFSMAELRARIRAQLRRLDPATRSAGSVRKFLDRGSMQIDPDRLVATRDGESIELTPTEFDLLYLLAEVPGKAWPRADLLQQVLGYEHAGYARAVDSHMARLRKKIEPDPANPTYLLTVHRVGYRFRDTE